MKFVVKRMSRREDGYEAIAYFSTAEESIEYIKAYKAFYNPIDIYFTFA